MKIQFAIIFSALISTIITSLIFIFANETDEINRSTYDKNYKKGNNYV